MAESRRRTDKKIGMWIDHKEAIVVLIDGEQTAVERIESDAESHYHQSGGWKASGTNIAQAISNEKRPEERRRHQLLKFYRTIIENIADTRSIYIFGPGEAKLELAKELDKIKGHNDREVTTEPSDKLTQNQIVARVKSFFKVKK